MTHTHCRSCGAVIDFAAVTCAECEALPERSYLGATLGALAVTRDERHRRGLEPWYGPGKAEGRATFLPWQETMLLARGVSRGPNCRRVRV